MKNLLKSIIFKPLSLSIIFFIFATLIVVIAFMPVIELDRHRQYHHIHKMAMKKAAKIESATFK